MYVALFYTKQDSLVIYNFYRLWTISIKITGWFGKIFQLWTISFSFFEIIRLIIIHNWKIFPFMFNHAVGNNSQLEIFSFTNCHTGRNNSQLVILVVSSESHLGIWSYKKSQESLIIQHFLRSPKRREWLRIRRRRAREHDVFDAAWKAAKPPERIPSSFKMMGRSMSAIF